MNPTALLMRLGAVKRLGYKAPAGLTTYGTERAALSFASLNPLGRTHRARLHCRRFYHRRIMAGPEQMIAAAARFGAQNVFVSRTELFAHAQIGQKIVNQSGNPGDVGEGVDLILNQTERVPGDLQTRLEQAHQFAEFANARQALFEHVQILLKRVAHLGRRLSGGVLFDARDFTAQSGFDVAVIAGREQVVRPQHPRVIVAERRKFFDDAGKQPRGARVSKLVRAPLDLVTQPPQRIIIVLVIAGQRFYDGRFGLLGLDPAVFVLTRPDDALDARMLRDE